ncbi:hypothetical protein [Streptomyces sp. EN16]|uniref:hypothetical protein n=1 Tax=Streptomyces sp. EN16 TaxID=212773 RepID=UPI00114CC2A7|nr:hypothetical protein [Streptomyces sp. EN16]
MEKFSRPSPRMPVASWEVARTWMRAWGPAKSAYSRASTAGDFLGSLFSRIVFQWRASWPRGAVGGLEHQRQARQVVDVAALVDEVEPVLKFGPQAGQGVVDVGDLAAVGDAGHAAGLPVRDPRVVEDQGVGAVVEELGGEGAQDGRGAAAGAGADQDVRSFGVQVGADRLSVVGGEPIRAREAGSASSCSRTPGSLRRSVVVVVVVFFVMVRCSFSVLCLVNRVFFQAGGSCRPDRAGLVRGRRRAGKVSRGRWCRPGAGCGPTS